MSKFTFTAFSARRFFSAIVVSLLISSISIAQVTIKGIVKDDVTGETMIGAAVVIKGSTNGGVTDIDGKFEFIAPNSPPFTLVISFLGYKNQEIEVKSLDQKLSIGLSTNEVLMSEVKVVGERISEKQKESPLTVESMDVLAIKETPAANFYEGLGQLKGVDLTSASIGFKIINTRGFNSTSPVRSLQIIDGVDNQSPGLNFSLGNFLGASELDVMKVDLVVGASSAYFGPNAFNGVISMTTKNPFQFPGLSVMGKVGERGLFEGAIRYAKVFKNKEEEDKFAFKLNVFFMRANDWVADNMDTASGSVVDVNNPGGYDAVNRYGDENLTLGRNNASSKNQQVQNPGLGRWHRTGYIEQDIVDYNSQNIKTSLALHYKLQPETELIYAFNFGTGTTVYQGDNRYSLKDILFFQNRIELRKKNKYFIRAYSTNENAGKSFDAVFTAFMIQDAAKTQNDWSTDYGNFWGINIKPKVLALDNFPTVGPPDWLYDFDQADAIMLANNDSIVSWHQMARDFADNDGATPFYEPGTARFDSALTAITEDTLGAGGTRLIDFSALYHVHGEYKFTPDFMNIVVGANYRMYRPESHGTIFSDTGDVPITNQEIGAYVGVEKKILNDKIKLNLTSRIDKNENFDYVVSPAASIVYSYRKNHIVRLSFSSAIRNPTLADQYLYYNVGRAILIGNINGYDSLVTLPSLVDFFSTPFVNPDTLDYFNIDPVRPEKVKSIEIGYRATLFDRLYLDASYYYSVYKDFLGYKLGADVHYTPSISWLNINNFYRVAANADSTVTTRGFSVGMNYFFKKYIAINGNYSWNTLATTGTEDPIVPAFNTPEHKYNIGMSGRDINTRIKLSKIWSKLPNIPIRNFGFSFNYKWVEGFAYEGSPQFTGFVPTYDMFDIQVSKHIPKIDATFKLGASNIFNNQKFQVYGGPRIGRLVYFSILVEID